MNELIAFKFQNANVISITASSFVAVDGGITRRIRATIVRDVALVLLRAALCTSVGDTMVPWTAF